MSIDASNVYIGLWTNWSAGNALLGSTMTLPSSIAAGLTALTAIYVSLAMTHFWRLAAFSLHCARQGTTQRPARPILQQQQIVLGAGLPPTTTAIVLAQLLWASRSAKSSVKDAWLPIVLSSACAIGSVAAGFLSSNIFNSSPKLDVLVTSPNCGFFPDMNSIHQYPPKVRDAFFKEGLDLLYDAWGYSQRCYNGTGGDTCYPFVTRTIDWETNWHSECPFAHVLCNGSAIQLDTGLVNTNAVLGLNARPEDQLDLRKIMTCAPVAQENYTTIFNASLVDEQAYPGEKFVSYNYGGLKDDTNASALITSLYSTYNRRTSFQRYLFTRTYSTDPDTASDFSPIPEMNTTEGITTLFFIASNALRYTEPCNDPIFGANVPADPFGPVGGTYLADIDAGVLGCVEQYQLCEHKGLECSDLAAPDAAGNQLMAKTSLRPMQLATMRLIDYSLSSLYRAGLNSGLLVANQKVASGLQPPLPSNQWQLEVQALNALSMTVLRQMILKVMTGYSSPDLQEHVSKPTRPEEITVCRSQRLRLGIGSGFTNISTFGLLFTIGLGTIIILSSLLLNTILCFLGRYAPITRARQKRWIQDGALQLHRIAHTAQAGENAGLVWTDISKDIPRVKDGTLLGLLDDYGTHRGGDGEKANAHDRDSDTGWEDRGTGSETDLLPFRLTKTFTTDERALLRQQTL